MSLTNRKCEGPYVQPCIEYADDRVNIRLYQWCAACLAKLSDRLNHQPIVVNSPIRFNVDAFSELARRWSRPLVIADRHGKHYGTKVLDSDGVEIVTFWSAEGEPSAREKRYFGDWSPERWGNYCCDSHWESEADYRAAVEFVALVQALDEHQSNDPAGNSVSWLTVF